MFHALTNVGDCFEIVLSLTLNGRVCYPLSSTAFCQPKKLSPSWQSQSNGTPGNGSQRLRGTALGFYMDPVSLIKDNLCSVQVGALGFPYGWN